MLHFIVQWEIGSHELRCSVWSTLISRFCAFVEFYLCCPAKTLSREWHKLLAVRTGSGLDVDRPELCDMSTRFTKTNWQCFVSQISNILYYIFIYSNLPINVAKLSTIVFTVLSKNFTYDFTLTELSTVLSKLL